MLGKGGHAEVYKGQLRDGQLVAVKRLTNGKNEETRLGDFLSELGIIAHVNHPNAAQLLGFSAEGGLHMILKFSPHGSLASLLHGKISFIIPPFSCYYFSIIKYDFLCFDFAGRNTRKLPRCCQTVRLPDVCN